QRSKVIRLTSGGEHVNLVACAVSDNLALLLTGVPDLQANIIRPGLGADLDLRRKVSKGLCHLLTVSHHRDVLLPPNLTGHEVRHPKRPPGLPVEHRVDDRFPLGNPVLPDLFGTLSRLGE